MVDLGDRRSCLWVSIGEMLVLGWLTGRRCLESILLRGWHVDCYVEGFNSKGSKINFDDGIWDGNASRDSSVSSIPLTID